MEVGVGVGVGVGGEVRGREADRAVQDGSERPEAISHVQRSRPGGGGAPGIRLGNAVPVSGLVWRPPV